MDRLELERVIIVSSDAYARACLYDQFHQYSETLGRCARCGRAYPGARPRYYPSRRSYFYELERRDDRPVVGDISGWDDEDWVDPY